MSDDEARVRAIALEDNQRRAKQCRQLITDLTRAEVAWRVVGRRHPLATTGKHDPGSATHDPDIVAAFQAGSDVLEGMIEALETRARCYDAAAERVAEAIGHAYAGGQP